MNVHSPASLDVIRHFAQGDDGITHFTLDRAAGSAHAFRREECDRCGCACEGANPVNFCKVPLPGLLVIAGLEPVEHELPELGCNDDGEAVCPSCASQEVEA